MRTLEDYARLIGASSSDAEAAALVAEAIDAPGVFFYAALLDLPPVRRLRSSAEHTPLVAALEALSYGSPDALRCSLGPRGGEGRAKAQKLAVLSLCARDGASGALRLRDVREAAGASEAAAEALLVDMMADGLLRGRIDQRAGLVRLEEFAARDVAREDIPQLRVKLDAWQRACDAQIAMLQKTELV